MLSFFNEVESVSEVMLPVCVVQKREEFSADYVVSHQCSI